LEEALKSFLTAGYRRDQVMKLLLGIAMKTISNYLNRISPTASDEQFEVERV
jgi:transposase